MHVSCRPVRAHCIAEIDRISEELAIGQVDDEILATGTLEGNFDPSALIFDGTHSATDGVDAFTCGLLGQVDAVAPHRNVNRRTCPRHRIDCCELDPAALRQIEHHDAIEYSTDTPGEHILPAHKAGDIGGHGLGVDILGR